MAGLVPAIHDCHAAAQQGVDARAKAGHDGVYLAARSSRKCFSTIFTGFIAA
jgi:hypothetical protein